MMKCSKCGNEDLYYEINEKGSVKEIAGKISCYCDSCELLIFTYPPPVKPGKEIDNLADLKDEVIRKVHLTPSSSTIGRNGKVEIVIVFQSGNICILTYNSFEDGVYAWWFGHKESVPDDVQRKLGIQETETPSLKQQNADLKIKVKNCEEVIGILQKKVTLYEKAMSELKEITQLG